MGSCGRNGSGPGSFRGAVCFFFVPRMPAEALISFGMLGRTFLCHFLQAVLRQINSLRNPSPLHNRGSGIEPFNILNKSHGRTSLTDSAFLFRGEGEGLEAICSAQTKRVWQMQLLELKCLLSQNKWPRHSVQKSDLFGSNK